jgi:hypothetical protein
MNAQPKNNIKKFKNIPFVWENENYLLKMKSDTSVMLYNSHFSRFLVYPSIKNSGSVAQGGGAQGLKKLKVHANQRSQRSSKLTIPLQNQLMKIIRQSEVYIMEEAVTDQIVKTTKI